MTNGYKSAFWSRLAEAMTDKEMKVTQKSAGALIDVSQTGARKWQEDTLPSMENATLLADKLGVCVEWLYTGRGPKRPIDLYRMLDCATAVESWLVKQEFEHDVSPEERESLYKFILDDFPGKIDRDIAHRRLSNIGRIRLPGTMNPSHQNT